MAGHSKWAQIKHKKIITDAARGRLFTKLANAITIAAREKGPDPATNFKLRLAIAKAKEANMPTENIERASKRGIGEVSGVEISEQIYEGYGPAGVALLIYATTDNKNRTTQEIRSTLERNGGRLSGTGSVAWIFEQKGVIRLKPDQKNKEEIELAGIDAGAKDLTEEDDEIVFYTEPAHLEKVKKNLAEKEIEITSAEVTMIPKNTIKISDPDQAGKVLKLMDELDNLVEVADISSNFDIPAQFLKKAEGVR